MHFAGHSLLSGAKQEAQETAIPTQRLKVAEAGVIAVSQSRGLSIF